MPVCRAAALTGPLQERATLTEAGTRNPDRTPTKQGAPFDPVGDAFRLQPEGLEAPRRTQNQPRFVRGSAAPTLTRPLQNRATLTGPGLTQPRQDPDQKKNRCRFRGATARAQPEAHGSHRPDADRTAQHIPDTYRITRHIPDTYRIAQRRLDADGTTQRRPDVYRTKDRITQTRAHFLSNPQRLEARQPAQNPADRVNVTPSPPKERGAPGPRPWMTDTGSVGSGRAAT
jgi:hypothetical protein